MALFARLKEWARSLKRDVLTLWFCIRDPEMPLAAKLVAALVVGYALSPIDLIPDFIPVLGYLDDVILVPLGVWAALRLVPSPVLERGRRRAGEWLAARRPKPKNYVAAAFIVLAWGALLWGAWALAQRWLG